ncbi:hypothetical protein [Nostoc sp.]|uniref:hypothetical protein n=1 Tax=Nostoc sp. TaxID=1180 RepID=UPI002FFA86A0
MRTISPWLWSGFLLSSKIISVRMDRQGILDIDQHFQTVRLMRYLNNQAFPKNPVKINQKGEIVVQNSK